MISFIAFIFGWLLGVVIVILSVCILVYVLNKLEMRKYRKWMTEMKNKNIRDENGNVIWNGVSGVCGKVTYLSGE